MAVKVNQRVLMVIFQECMDLLQTFKSTDEPTVSAR